MQALIPEVHGIAAEKREDAAHDGQNAGQIGGGVRVFDRGPKRHVAEVEQEQDEERGQARIPRPVGAPHRFAPDRPGEKRDDRHHDAHEGGGLGGQRAHMMAADEPDERGHKHHHPDVDRHHRAWHVDIDDLDRRAEIHRLGREEKAPDQPDCQREDRQSDHPRKRLAGQGHELDRVGPGPKPVPPVSRLFRAHVIHANCPMCHGPIGQEKPVSLTAD